jgi:hypothetical protein
VPGGFVLAGALFFLILMGQVLIAPAVLVAVLGLAVPVVLVAERRGAFRALWSSLTLQYARGSKVSGWGVLFHLLSLGALLYALLAGVGLICEVLLDLDERLGIGRQLWAQTLPGLPFGGIYLGVSLMEACLTMGLVGLMPALTAALYFRVVEPRKIGSA